MYLYCNYIVDTAGDGHLLPESKAKNEVVYLQGVLANQLTNILKDVGEEYISYSLQMRCV
jgi:hypothetical protein